MLALRSSEAGTRDEYGALPRSHRRRPSAAENDLGLSESRDSRAMILLDTNVLIYASTDRSPFLEWADEGRFRTYLPSVILRTP